VAVRGKKNVDTVLLLALACGSSAENAARKAGVHERTVQRRLADPAFQKQVKDLQAEMVQRSMGMLTAAAMEAVKTLVELSAPSAPPATRLGAARSIIEIGTKLRESIEYEARLAALEQRLDDAKKRDDSSDGPTTCLKSTG
jgi:hypothetical protein